MRIFTQLVYGFCVSSKFSEEECELSSDEVAQFFDSVQAAQAAGSDISLIRPPHSNPYRAKEYADGGEY